MGLIKSANTPASITPFSMRDIEAQARAMLLRARQQADQMLAAAQTEAVEFRQKAYNEGFVAGKEDGQRRGMEEGLAAGQKAALAEHRAKLEQLIKSLIESTTAFNSTKADLLTQANREVVKLGVAIGRRVTKLHASIDPNVLNENVVAAVKLVTQCANVRIAINPAQRQTLNDALPKLAMQWPALAHVELIDDANISVGGCKVFAGQGEIDADLDHQLDRIAADVLPKASS